MVAAAEAPPNLAATSAATRYSPLSHREAAWYGSTFRTGPDWTRGGKDWQHPGESTPSVRRFEAPRAGRVAITGRVFKLHLAGDGIRASIRHNEREIWNVEIGGKDAQGVELAVPLEVKSGDVLRFIVDKRGNIGSDTTGWDPVVAYVDGERYQASVGFAAKKQGAGGWFYETVGEGKPAAPPKPSILGPAAFPEPPTVALTVAAADELLVRDWRAQRGSTLIGVSCRQELMRVERVLQRISGRLAPAEQARWQQRLAEWRGRLETESNDELYLGLRRMKRELLLADPAIDFTGLLCIDNPYVHGSEAVHEIRHRHEDTATPGGRLLVLDGLRPDARVRKLAPSGVAAAFWRPDLSFDGTKVLFCMKAADQPAYHLYEVGLDGKGWRQITDGDYNDLDPIYAPDGGIIFSTTRCNHYLRCGGSKFRMFILARCDSDGKNLYFISANNEADYAPSFLPDGRVIYTRWEYVDKSVLRVQSLWTVNPDGTGASTFWGNQSKWPDMLLNPRVIPGTNQVVFSATGHHDAYAGPLGVVAPDEGLNYPDGVYNLTPRVPWAEVGAGPADKPYNKDFQAPACYGAFQTPYPINKDLLLVSARVGQPVATMRDPELSWFQLYLMDYDGNMELLYKGAFNVLHAQPIRARPMPHLIPTNVRWPGKMIAADQSPAGIDALLSTVQMPPGIPVASMAIGKAGAINAAVFAMEILALSDEKIAAKLTDFRKVQRQKVIEKDSAV